MTLWFVLVELLFYDAFIIIIVFFFFFLFLLAMCICRFWIVNGRSG